MNFYTRKWVKPEDIKAQGRLFGGSWLRWIDEEAAMYAIIQLGTNRAVTTYMSEFNLLSASKQGDIIDLGMKATKSCTTSITMECEVRNKITCKSVLTIEKMVFVSVEENGNPTPHGKTKTTYTDSRLREDD